MADRAFTAYLVPRRRIVAGGMLLPRRGEESFLETLTVVAVVAVLAALALVAYAPVTMKFRMVESASLASAYRTEVVETFATTGVLPESLVVTDASGRFFEHAVWRDGEIVLDLEPGFAARVASGAGVEGPAPLRLSFRTARSADADTVVFLCGLSNPPTGFSAAPSRNTTVPEQFLPHFCRD